MLESLVTTGLVALLGIWARRLSLAPGAVPVYDSRGRAYWLAGIALALVASVASQLLDRDVSTTLPSTGADVSEAFTSAPPTGWIYAAATTLGAVMLLAVYHGLGALAGILLGLFLLLTGGAVARHDLFAFDEMLRQRARGVYTILIHVVAFVTLSMVYLNKLRSLFSATAVLALGVALLIALTEGEDLTFARRLVYALAGGLLLGEVAWVTNYWRATGWTGGATLLIFFYLAAGLIGARARRGIEARDVAEYAGIGAVAFGIVAYSLLR